MAIYLYCLLRATADPPPALAGIDGLPVRAVGIGGLRAWISEMSVTRIDPTVERARDHDRVVRAAMDIETPLPVRFGQVVGDRSVLEQGITSRLEQLTAALESVAGAVEMTVKVDIPITSRGGDSESDPRRAVTGRGREYLEGVAAALRREQNVLAEERVVLERMRQAVGALIRDEAYAGMSAGSNVASVSHLVPREHVLAYRSALQALRADDPALSLRVTGPWAPYSFTRVGTHDG